MNSIFVLHARAAQMLLHLLNLRCRSVAKKPVIHKSLREPEMANSHIADIADVRANPPIGRYLMVGCQLM